MEMFNQLQGESQKMLQELKKWTADSGAELAAVYGTMKKTGKNSVDGIVQWMKDVKLISSKETEEKVRAELDKAPDKKDVGFQQFRNTVFQVVEEQKKAFAEMEAAVKEQGGRLVAAFQAGTSAAQEALRRHDKTTGK
ncbi:uncharacterized protein LOC133532856 [Cydia pomonella]|uniref:uncharacterized protein LOC133532856 n=1 Tax=Cydia pomonella TaxID=82600 RepID=UPI002ADE8CEE|nr:uncharacterized protein LOC133532856 [Cydia pomonella]